jgi:gamma-glutamyltranspeptidase/glutathione hydrolase
MAATSHPAATDAALRMLRAGGNACDAAVAAAAMLCATEPMSTGLGGDAFALVWQDGRLSGLNGSGRAPSGIDPDRFTTAITNGPESVTVPGAVAAWADLLARHGRFGLDRCLAPAIDAAEQGFTVTPTIAAAWAALEPLLRRDPELARCFTPVPLAGTKARNPAMAAMLREIAAHGPAALYRGPIAEAICAVSLIAPEDLAGHRSTWVEPLRLRYRDVDVVELPPNGWGATALQAIGIADGLIDPGAALADRIHLQAEAVKLALADARRYIADGTLPGGYLDPAYLAGRRALVDCGRAGQPRAGRLPRGGTVYLCVVDRDRTACSFIQSLFEGFGSGIGVPGTAIALHNRGACFTTEPDHPNRIAPGRRPFHTIIPAMLLRDGDLLGPFGVMGGYMQPQGHLQVVSAIADRAADPQQALDAPRFRCDHDASGWSLALEPGLWPIADDLAARSHRVVREADVTGFGGGQAILVNGEVLVGGSDRRKDGNAAGIDID